MVGAFQNPVFTVWAMFFASLIGAFFAIALLVWRGKLLRTLGGMLRHAGTRLLPFVKNAEFPEEAGLTVPFGFAIALGVYWTYLLWLRGPL